MEPTRNMDSVANLLKNLSLSKDEKNDLYISISQNVDQFFEISESMVSEIKNIEDRYPKDWKEMLAMTMFSTL